MTVSAEYAAQHLDELLDSLEDGGSVEIVREGKRSAVLTGRAGDGAVAAEGKRVLGAGLADVRALLDDEQWEAADREWRQSYAEKFGLEAEQ